MTHPPLHVELRFRVDRLDRGTVACGPPEQQLRRRAPGDADLEESARLQGIQHRLDDLGPEDPHRTTPRRPTGRTVSVKVGTVLDRRDVQGVDPDAHLAWRIESAEPAVLVVESP